MGGFFVYGQDFDFHKGLASAHSPTHTMRLRLLRRRFTIAPPRLTVRRALPWPLRWLAAAVVLGLCAAVALWTFEMGRSLAGLEGSARLQGSAREEIKRLRADTTELREQNQLLQEQLSANESLHLAEQATMARLAEQVQLLEADNRTLRDDLSFFEKLLPPTSDDKALSIRGMHVESISEGAQLRWQVLAIQPRRNAPEFKGRLELVLAGLKDGQAWASDPPVVNQNLQFRQYRRVQGIAQVPPGVVVKTTTARLLEGSSVRALHVYKLD